MRSPLPERERPGRLPPGAPPPTGQRGSLPDGAPRLAAQLLASLVGGELPGELSALPLEELFRCATLLREVESGLLDGQGRFDEARLPWDISEPWISALAARLRGPGERAGAGRLRVVITHDIDEVTGLEPTGLTKSAMRALGFSPVWPAWSRAFPPKRWLANLERILDLEVQSGVGAYYFMLSGPYGLGRHSSRYDSRWAQSRRMARAIRSAGMTVGLHGSYGAREAESYARERARLEEAVEAPVLTHRNHYLRFDPLRVWDHLGAAGFEHDFSVGFNGRVGFRAGLAEVYPTFSLASGAPSPVRAVPLVFSDGALLAGEKGATLARLRAALERARECGGCVSLLFHPEAFLVDESMFGIFREVIGMCVEQGADLSGRLETGACGAEAVP